MCQRDVLGDEPRARVGLVHFLEDRLGDRRIGGGDAHADESRVELFGHLVGRHGEAESLCLVVEQLALDQSVERHALEVHPARCLRASRRHQQPKRRAEVLRIDATATHSRRADLAE